MRNIMLKLSFDGSGYHGFQLQKNADTIQSRLNNAVKEVTNEYICVNGCSRTDAGVHANEFTANFKTESKIPAENLKRALNSLLPDDIAILSVSDVHNSFNSRFDAKKKEYVYKILNSKIKNPFYRNYALFYPYPIDEKLMNQAAKEFTGKKDFKAFMASGSNIRDTVRTVYNSEVRRDGEFVLFTVSGDGFLYNMVRIMTGTLIYINEGKIEIESLSEIIKNSDRTAAGKTVPPNGLYLNRVFY